MSEHLHAGTEKPRVLRQFKKPENERKEKLSKKQGDKGIFSSSLYGAKEQQQSFIFSLFC